MHFETPNKAKKRNKAPILKIKYGPFGSPPRAKVRSRESAPSRASPPPSFKAFGSRIPGAQRRGELRAALATVDHLKT